METKTLTLAEFLLARIVQDQRHAEALWVTMQSDTFTASAALVNVGAIVDPRRVIAECEAKRRIIMAVRGWHHAVVEDCWYTCPAATEEREGGECCDDLRRGTECDCGRDHRVLMILAPLASVYSSHPDYRPEWRP